MKKKVVVLGSLGMLGQEVFSKLQSSPALEVTGTYHTRTPSNLDNYKKYEIGFSAEDLSALIKKADYIINCAAVLLSDIDAGNTENVKKAYDINGRFPRFLAEVAERQNTKVIHISTDGVFSGNTGSPLSEKTVPQPNDIYGKSKLEGETYGNNILNIRTSIIGRDPNYQRGLLEWFLKQPEGSEILGYQDIWHGVTNRQLADLILQIIEKDCFSKIVKESHLHHFCPNKPLSKFDLLAIFKKMFNKDITVQSVANPKGNSNRTLTSCYKTLIACYEGGTDIERAIQDLK